MLPQSRKAIAVILIIDYHTLYRHAEGAMDAYVLQALNHIYGSTTALNFAIVSADTILKDCLRIFR